MMEAKETSLPEGRPRPEDDPSEEARGAGHLPHKLTVYASDAPVPDAPATLVIGRLQRMLTHGAFSGGTFPRRIAQGSGP